MVNSSTPGRITGTPESGTGLLAVFCDLASEHRSDFRPWLAEDMFPPRIAIGFGPAASFDLIEEAPLSPAAPPQAYVTLYVAPALGDLYGPAYQGLRAKRAPRDAAYHRNMQNQARYTGGWVGPGIEADDQSFAPVIVIDRFNLDPSDTQAFNIWYAREYLPACAEIDGLMRLRRYLTMEGTAEHLLIHEFSSEADLTDISWQSLRKSGHWNQCRFAPGAPAAYRKIVDAGKGENSSPKIALRH
jgi:hypothetical protein